MSKDETTSTIPLILNEDETGLLYLIDKYIKANNNFLPLQAYLNYLETNTLSSFQSVSFSSTSQINVYNNKYGTINTNSSTLITINKNEEQKCSHEGISIAQKLYKIIISIDYSPQVTNLDFIQKSLEKIFEKLTIEYDQFTDSIQLEPQIYVTVLLWNSVYFQYRHQNNQSFNNMLNDDFIPFTIICHAKRLLKSNLAEMASYLYEKVNENKNAFLTAFKNSQQQKLQNDIVMSDVSNKLLKPVDQSHAKIASNVQNNKDVGSLERLLVHILKIFSFFNVNNTATSLSAPTALSSAHHIYISDGLFYANDMIRCLEKISKSSVTFSFIYSGSGINQKQHHSANNISSSFGYVADHYLMKFIAHITNGFFAVIDENLDHYFIYNKRLLFFTTLLRQNDKSNDLTSDTLIENVTNSEDDKLYSSSQPQSNSFCCSSNVNNENVGNMFYMTHKDHLKTNINSGAHRFSNYKTNSKQIIKEDQQLEIKCIQKYDLSTNGHSIYQLTRFRSQEGFFLVQITKQQLNPKLCFVTLHFKRYFTQTTVLFYKLSYYTGLFKKQESPMLATSPKWTTFAESESNNDKLSVEIWLSWNFLHLKAKYQNVVLIHQLRHALNHIQKIDFDRSFTLTNLMLTPPEILTFKEPLFKITSPPVNANNNSELNDLKTLKFSMQNLNFEINMRSKGVENEKFIDFANSWLSLAFFKINTSTLIKHFGVHTVKLILDHDKSLSNDICSNIFTLKSSLSILENQQSQQTQHSNPVNCHSNEPIYENEFIYGTNFYDYGLNNQNNMMSNVMNTYHNTNTLSNNTNNNTANNSNNSNIFQCRHALNKLCVMLIDWCDLILVENCVFLKYLNPSQTPTDKSKYQSTEREEMNNEEKELNEPEITTTKDSSKSLIKPLMDRKQNESFVIIKLDTSFVPYVSLQYLFHSSINYLDRMRLIQKFKEKLKVLNLKNLDTDSNVTVASAGMTTPPQPVIITPPQQTSQLNKMNQASLASPSNFRFNNSLLFNQTETATIASLNSKLKKKQQECCCILLQKPDLFDTILSHFNKMNNQQPNSLPDKKSGQQQWQQNPSQVLNFMKQKKFKWSINKQFSTQVSLSLKENIIDTFIKTRLREGFKCLFQCSKFAVFTIQLNMFDQGGLCVDFSRQNSDSARKATLNESDSLSNTSKNSSKEGVGLSFKSGSSQFCTFVYVVYFMNSIQQYYYNKHASKTNQQQKTEFFLPTNLEQSQRKLNDPNDKQDPNELSPLVSSSYENEIYFTTELYSEVIDGVYQDQDKKQNLTTDNKKSQCDYFKHLTHTEILNLIFLIDLRSFVTIQSVSTLFLNKSNSILNLYSLLNGYESTGDSLTPLPKSGNYFFSQETATKILNYNPNFYESIRMLPDLNLITKSLQSLVNNQSISRLNSEAPSSLTGPPNLLNRIRIEKQQPQTESDSSFKGKSPALNKLSYSSSNEQDTKETAVIKKKKSDSVLLHEQLKPVLNNLFSVSVNSNIPRDLISISFQFSLRSILFESSMFMSVFEDVPLNLFSNGIKSTNESIYKIQKLFFANIDENFKKNDPNSSNNFASALAPRSQLGNRGSTASVDDFETKNQHLLIDFVKKEIKNTICLKLNDIKSGDTIIKQIIENLNSNVSVPADDTDAKNFQYYFKFNVSQATSDQTEHMTANWTRNMNPLEEQNDNRFFIFGLFFLNYSNDMQQVSNRLVFFIFDCMFDNIKKSLISSNSNTYLIRKSLFSTQKISHKFNQTPTTESNKLAFSDTHRFYCNKSASDSLRSNTNQTTNRAGNMNRMTSSDLINSRNSIVPSTTTPSNFMKKVFSISDILKFHLPFNNNSNDLLFVNYVDFIEENCAKSYIESVIHYVGIHSSINAPLYRSLTANEDKRVKFETSSIKQLLKIGRKSKLVDLDLTEYLKIICNHLNCSESSDWTKKCNSKHNYLEKKFNDLFLKKFNLLPGFNDLFIFTPNQYYKNIQKSHDDQISSIDHSFDNGNSSDKNKRRRCLIRKNHKKKKLHLNYDNNSYLGTLKATAQSSESIKNLIEKEVNESMNKSLDELFRHSCDTDDDEEDDDEYYDYDEHSDSEDNSDTNEKSFIDTKMDSCTKNLVHSSTATEEDATTTDMDEDMLHLHKTTLRTRRKTNKFKSSSPFSNSSVILNKNFDPSKESTAAKSISYEKSSEIAEQLISIELVCIIGTDSDDTLMPTSGPQNEGPNNGSTTDLDECTKQSRVRRTTLTPDYSSTNTDSLLGLNNSGNSNLDIRTSETIHQTESELNLPRINPFKGSNSSSSKRSIFFSKFNKFNLQCLLDLIEEKDQNEFKLLVKQLESELDYSESKNETLPSSGSFNMINNVKVYLRFNWYSFNELNSNYTTASLLNNNQQQNINSSSTSKLMTQQSSGSNSGAFASKLLLQQQRVAASLLMSSNYQSAVIDTNLLMQKPTFGTGSLHSSSSTVYNSLTNVASSNTQMNTNAVNGKFFNRNVNQPQFEYNHLLNPILNEFKWHLRDEIFQLEQTSIKNLLVFISHMSHIDEGVRRKYSHCRLTNRKIILNKITTTTTTTLVDPKPKTNASKLLSVNHLREQQQQQMSASSSNKPAFKIMKHVEEDKSILSVDPQKFLVELISLVKNLDNKFYDCKLQQIHEYLYYLNCNLNNTNKMNFKLDDNFKDYNFKILIHLHNNSFKKTLNNEPKVDLQAKEGNKMIINNQQVINKEITINQIKMKIFFSFNHTSFQSRDDLIDSLIIQFNQLLNKLIKSVYLSLTLKEIHDSRKWNNLLQLIDNTAEETKKNIKTNKSSSSLTTTANADINDSVLTIKNNTVQGSLACNCVWSVKFKLHRLHQTIQKIHGSTEITPSTPGILQQQQHIASTSSLQQQQYISQGLKKLQESLVNFKIEESSKCGDLYVYTRKDEIFLLKLEELYEQQHSLNQTNLNNLAASDIGDSSIAYNESSIDLGASYARQQQQQKTGSSLLSRRPSYASINDNDIASTFKSNQTYNVSVGNTTITGGKSQNLSGGSINNSSNQMPSQTNLNTTPIGTLPQQQQQQQQRSNPEYIKLSVYGLTEPDEEMKQDLCKTLQSELDYWLLIKMCNSIEKNTFKTTSAQHPDKITDEDLTFFKSISENYFDFEIPLPFIFNFNKQMRENFFYFIKQIFNANFKAIDAPMSTNSNLSSNQYLSASNSNSSSANSNQLRKSFSMRAKSQSNQQQTDYNKPTETENDEYDELAHLIYNDECATEQPVLSSSTSAVKTSTQTVSSMFHSQQLSFSFMSLQPQLGPYSNNKSNVSPLLAQATSLDGSMTAKPLGSTKRLSEQDPFMIMLSRILFHNSKNMRIGKHTVSLVLVEALYAVKSLDVLVLSRVTRSNSIGATPLMPNITPKTTTNQQNSQILETSYTQSKLTGPTFVFRFYCRGENDTNAYKLSLKSALNDALLYFFSEYITKIDPDHYLKKIRLSKVPAQFRKFRFQSDSLTGSSSAQKDLKKIKKRHKSTGNCGDDSKLSAHQPDLEHESEELSLNMNKTALSTKLGKLILKQQIATESQFNKFTLHNFNGSLFDCRDYEDTIEYFRESIRAFDYNRILNSFINDSSSLMSDSSSSLLMSTSSTSASSIETNDETNLEYSSDSSTSSRSSIDDSVQKEAETPKLAKSKMNAAFKKSHLRFIYEWLKGLYLVQIRAGANLCSRSVGSINIKPPQQQPSQQRINPINNLSSSLILSPMQQQQQQQQQQFLAAGTSPSNLSGSLANIISSNSGQQQPFGPFILRKKFCYKTKYNLTSLLRDIEIGLRDSCKSNEITVNYFSFNSQKTPQQMNRKQKTPLVKTEHSTSDESSHKELKSCLRNPTDASHKQQADYYANCFGTDSILLDDSEFGNDFKNLKQTKFSNLHTNLSKLENLIITMNVEYCLPVIVPSTSTVNVFTQPIANNNVNIATGSSLSSSSSNNSSSNVLHNMMNSTASQLTTSTIVPSYSRVPSFTGITSNNTKQNSALYDQPPNVLTNNLMTKSMNSNSGVDLLDLSLSVSNSLSMAALQLKRTYLYALCNARTKMITFYVFTTESACHEQLRQLLDTSCETCLQRYHLVNNTVLYKYGGLIGDSMIHDLKKVKLLTCSAVVAACNNKNNSLLSNDSNTTLTTSDQSDFLSKAKTNSTNLAQNSPKLIYRQLSYKMPDKLSNHSQPINTSLISNLTQQFGSSTSNSSSTTSLVSQPQQQFSFKQLFMAATNYKSFDSIINIVNQQVNFCQQYLTHSNDSFNTSTSLSHSPSFALLATNNNLNHSSLNRQTSLVTSSTNANLNAMNQQQRLLPTNPYSFYSTASTLYGVGLNYQLYELHQVFRHPRKIYELALTLANNSSQQTTSAGYGLKPPTLPATPMQLNKSGQQLNVNDFYKNYIVPVLIPFHFCCSPILFCSNWNDLIVNEQSLRAGFRPLHKSGESKNQVMQSTPSSQSSGSVGSSTTALKPNIKSGPNQPQANPLMISTDVWYQKMRQIFLTEYTKYFESRGFLRLKDDIKETSNQTNKNIPIPSEIQTYHFIKWVQQDGFIYITVNLEEIFVNIKLGYCTRYRMASRAFLSDLVRFFAQDFHVHSLTYDYHLTAINRNLIPSSWSSPKHMSLTISKFLDEFVEFFSRVPLFSSNKVFKVIYEKTDYSVMPRKFGLIFDFMMFAKKKLNKNGQFNNTLFTPLDVNLDNNIGIYTLSDQKPDSYSKYLVIKIESFITTTLHTVTTHSSSSLNKKTTTKTESSQSNKTVANKPVQSKLSTSSSSSSLINQRTLGSENSFNNLTQIQQNQLMRQSSIQQQQVPVKQIVKSSQTKQDSYIRLVCYYLCINKQASQLTTHEQNSQMYSSVGHNLFDQDLLFIDKIVEESINVYKQETFWDNLMISMSSITDYLNETSANTIPTMFDIECGELEQILDHSQRIDALELDPSLNSFLQECYSIKDKIRNTFEFSFGRHFIFTSSDSVDYCLLLINDNLIKKFRYTVSSGGSQSVINDRILQSNASSPSSSSSSNSSTTKVSSSSSDNNSDRQLNSFILIKFDKVYKMTHLWQINRIFQQEQQNIAKATTDYVDATANTLTRKISSNKYLSFTINNLMYVLWEGLFSSS